MWIQFNEFCGRLGPETFKGSMTIYLDHGLLMIEDRDSDAVYDDLIPGGSGGVVTARFDSVCIAGRISVDGPVTIVAYTGEMQLGSAVAAFEGVIDAPSGWLQIEDSDGFSSLLMRAPAPRVSLSIHVDDPVYPSYVAIAINSADLSAGITVAVSR